MRTPCFLDQILRQVFYKNSDGKARLEMVQKHMLVMEDLFRRSLLKKLYIDCQRVLIWEDEYKGKPLILYLVFREGQQKEGCLSLELIYDSVDLVNTG